MGEVGCQGRASREHRERRGGGTRTTPLPRRERVAVAVTCDVEIARLRPFQDRERALVGIEEADREGRLLGSLIPAAPVVEMALVHEGTTARKASAGVAPWSP